MAIQFEWVETHPELALCYALLFHLGGVKPSFREIFTRLVRLGRERIEAILKHTAKPDEKDLAYKAALIQNQIMAVLSYRFSSNLFADTASAKQEIEQFLRRTLPENHWPSTKG